MNTRTKKQLTVLIMVAMLLVLLIVAAVFLMPGGNVIKTIKNSGKDNVSNMTSEETVNKFDFVGRIFDKDMQPIGNAKFLISCGPTEFTTDENGYFRLNGLPVGIYKLYAVIDGKQVGETEVQLSNDGCITIGYVFFEQGTVVTMIFDGEKFTGVEIKSDTGETEQVSSDTTTDENEENLSYENDENESSDNSSQENNSSDNTEEPDNQPDDGTEEEDPTYTNLSWMKDVPYGFGAYGLNMTYTPELFLEVVKDPQYDYINTYLVEGKSLEMAIYTAEILAENEKYFFLNVHDLLSLGRSNVDENLKGNWRSNLDMWAAHLYDVAGDWFQGFYFDEVDLYLNAKDFTRVTKYMREHFGLRTFAVHRRDPFTLPASFGMHISRYKGQKFVINAENHKYVTDVGWWWYGGYDYYGYNAERLGDLWKEAMDLLDPNTRKWIVPPIGSFDFRHDEEDSIEVAYAMYREASKLEGFGGLMYYTMQEGGLWGGYGKITVDNEKLTDDDFLKDENGDFVYVEKVDSDGNKVYRKDKNGNYVLDKDGNKIPELTKVLDIKKNNSVTALRDGMMEYGVEGGGGYLVMTKKADGTYEWPRARKYFEIIGKGITSGESRESILAKLDKVHKPDYSKYKK